MLSTDTKRLLISEGTKEIQAWVILSTIRHKGISLKLLQISFDLFQLISSKFWKSLIFDLFDGSFSHFQWNRFLNKFAKKYLLPALLHIHMNLEKFKCKFSK